MEKILEHGMESGLIWGTMGLRVHGSYLTSFFIITVQRVAVFM